MKIDPKKLLPPSESSIELASKGAIQSKKFLVPVKNTVERTKVEVYPKSLEPIPEENKKESSDDLIKELLIIKKTTIDIDKLLKETYALKQKQINDQRKLKEDSERKLKEKKLETKPEDVKGLKKSKLPMPKIGFMEMIMRFIGGILLGYAIEKLWKYLPILAKFTKLITPVTKFIEFIAGTLFKALVNFIDLGYTAYDKVRDFTKKIGGESFQKTFDEFSGVLNTLITTAIAIAIATSGGSDFGLGDLLDPKKPKGPGGPKGQRPRGVTQGKGGGKPSFIDRLRGNRPEVTQGKGGRKPSFFDRFRRDKPRITGGKTSFLDRITGIKDRITKPFKPSRVTVGGRKPSYIDRVKDIFGKGSKVTGTKQGFVENIVDRFTKAKALGLDVAKDTRNILDIDKITKGIGEKVSAGKKQFLNIADQTKDIINLDKIATWGRTKATEFGKGVISTTQKAGKELIDWAGKGLSGLGKNVFEFVSSKYKQATDFGARIGKGIANIAEIAKKGPNALADIARSKIESTIKPLIQQEGPVKTIFNSIKNAVKNPKEVAKGLGGLLKGLVTKPEIKGTRDLLKQVQRQYKVPFIDKAIAAIVAVFDYATGTPMINAILSAIGGLLGWSAGFAIGAPFGGLPGFFTGTAGAIAGDFIAKQLVNQLAKTPLAKITDPIYPDRKIIAAEGGSEEVPQKEEGSKDKPPTKPSTKDDKPKSTGETNKVDTQKASTGGIIGESDQKKAPLEEITRGGQKVGEEITRGGQKVGGEVKRTIKITKKSKKLSIKPSDKVILGRDVGGKHKIESLFSNPSDKDKKNPLKFLESTSNKLKEIPFLGTLMGSTIDMVLGQKPDSNVYNSLGATLGNFVQSLLDSGRTATESEILSSTITMADGGVVEVSKDTLENKNDSKSNIDAQFVSDIVVKLFNPLLSSKVSSIFKDLNDQLNNKKDSDNSSDSSTTGESQGSSASVAPGSQDSPDLSGPAGPAVTGTKAEKWKQFYEMGKKAGAKYPELVSAQFALESGWGTALSAKHNYFGIKAAPGESASVKSTREEYGGQSVTIKAGFKNFNSAQDAVNHLVTQWYKDYKGYKGVNNASSANDAARMLKEQGYATDSQYTSSLQRLLKENAPLTSSGGPSKPQKPGAAVKAAAKGGLIEDNVTMKPFIQKDFPDLLGNNLIDKNEINKLSPMEQWANTNRVMIVKTGTTKQREILASVDAKLKKNSKKGEKKSPVKNISSMIFGEGINFNNLSQTDTNKPSQTIQPSTTIASNSSDINKSQTQLIPTDSSSVKTSKEDKISSSMQIWSNLVKSKDYKAADEIGKNIWNLKYQDTLAKPKTPNPLMKDMPGQTLNKVNPFTIPQLMDTSRVFNTSNTTSNISNISTDNKTVSSVKTSKEDKISSAMQIWNKLVKSKDYKAADEIGKNIWNLKYQDTLAKPKTPNPLMKDMPGQTLNKVNPFTIPQLINVDMSNIEKNISNTNANTNTIQKDNITSIGNFENYSNNIKPFNIPQIMDAGKEPPALQLQKGGPVDTSKMNLASTSTNDKISSAMQIWSGLVKSKDNKSADEMGKNIWNLKYKDTLAKPKIPNPLMSTKESFLPLNLKVNPFNIPQIIDTPKIDTSTLESPVSGKETEKKCKKLTPEMLTKKLQEVGLLETQTSYEESGVKSMVFIQPIKQTVEVPTSTSNNMFGF